MKQYELVIIGGGSAGLAAAITAYDEGIRSILLLEKEEYLGGILLQCIHSGFGLHEFKEQLSGPEYAERFVIEFQKRHIEYRVKSVVIKLEKDKKIHYSNSEEGYQIIQAKSIILATGCIERTRGAISLPGDRPSGIMTAGVAQRYLNIEGYMIGRKMFILGSGDIGLIMARRMTLEGAKVVGVAEIMPYSNGLTRNVVQCLHDYDIPLYLSHTVSKVIGKDRLEKIVLSQVDASLQPIPGTEKEFEVDTLLLSVGLIPANELFDQLGIPSHPKTRGALVNDQMETHWEGVFACGNVLHVHDLVDFVSAEGRKAGHGASKYLKGLLPVHDDTVKVETGSGVLYVVPSSIDLKNSETSIPFKFRVTTPQQMKYIVITCDNQIIYSRIKPYMLPAEMETVELMRSQIPENGKILTVSIQEKGAK